MPGHDMIVIGASAGGIEALSELVKDLPAELPGAVFVAVHIPAHSKSTLPKILGRRSVLPALKPED
ncbi:MAG TPA: chemotaxis protein CheB, partial [Blastocatellia bacterium]|nr:chemotaxis protein CheB [Blastocatellia bacterium]